MPRAVSDFAGDGRTACASERIDLLPNSSNPLWLWGANRPGQFDGSATIAVAEKPEGDTVSMTVYASTTRAKVWGIIVIFFAVLLTWFCTSFVRNRANRDRMLLPVSSLLMKLRDFRTPCLVRRRTCLLAQSIADQALVVSNDLSITNLALNGLPSKVPLWGATPDSTSMDAYRKYVQARGDWVQALRILVHEGRNRRGCTSRQAMRLRSSGASELR